MNSPSIPLLSLPGTSTLLQPDPSVPTTYKTFNTATYLNGFTADPRMGRPLVAGLALVDCQYEMQHGYAGDIFFADVKLGMEQMFQDAYPRYMDGSTYHAALPLNGTQVSGGGRQLESIMYSSPERQPTFIRIHDEEGGRELRGTVGSDFLRLDIGWSSNGALLLQNTEQETSQAAPVTHGYTMSVFQGLAKSAEILALRDTAPINMALEVAERIYFSGQYDPDAMGDVVVYNPITNQHGKLHAQDGRLKLPEDMTADEFASHIVVRILNRDPEALNALAEIKVIPTPNMFAPAGAITAWLFRPEQSSQNAMPLAQPLIESLWNPILGAIEAQKQAFLANPPAPVVHPAKINDLRGGDRVDLNWDNYEMHGKVTKKENGLVVVKLDYPLGDYRELEFPVNSGVVAFPLIKDGALVKDQNFVVGIVMGQPQVTESNPFGIQIVE